MAVTVDLTWAGVKRGGVVGARTETGVVGTDSTGVTTVIGEGRMGSCVVVSPPPPRASTFTMVSADEVMVPREALVGEDMEIDTVLFGSTT